MNKPAPTTAEAAGAVPEAEFYIPATGPAARPRRTLKHGDTFAVVDSHGDIGASAGGPDGIFHGDTRFLSRFEVLLNGMPLLLLGSSVRDDNATLTVDLTNPDIYFDKRLIFPKDTLHIVRTLFVWRGAVFRRLGIRNYGEQRVALRLSIGFGADFADVFEVRGVRRKQRGTAHVEIPSPQQALFVYDGLDEKRRQSLLTFDPVPAELVPGTAGYAIDLEPEERQSVFIVTRCEGDPAETERPFFQGMIAAAREGRKASRRAADIVTSNDLFNQVLNRSQADLRMLMTDTPEGPYPYAGIPWYSTTFGRDGLITALQTLWCDPAIARGVLRRLAACQATETNAESDAEPGKILHEMRSGEMATLGEVPFRLYYGSIDSTPLFVLVAGLYAERTGDKETEQALWPHVEAALDWIDRYGDRDGDGFVEYFRASEHGLANQGWKDSYDSVFHADGRLAEGPIALVEVQAYVFMAKRLAARMARRLGKADHAAALDRQAEELGLRFNASFWCPEIGTYALALDGDKRQCRVRTSNAGQILFSGIVPRERAVAVATGLMRPPQFSGWGIRTVSREEKRYNPMSYHDGSVWPHDNALIALGFAHYGYGALIERLFRGLFEAATYMDIHRLPELFCGFRRGRGHGPTLYPVACAPQAWASATPFALLQASIGLWFDPANREIRLNNPRLPSFLDEVVIRNLRLGESSLDLAIGRRGEQVSLHVLRRDGQINVSSIHT